MKIRPARADEVDAILGLWKAAGSATSVTDTVEDVAAVVSSAQAWVILAEDDEGLAGTVIAAWDGWRGHIYRLAVRPDLRRRGIATALLREAERALAAAGAKRIAAIVLVDHPDAAGFWAGSGYEHQAETGRFIRHLG